MPFDINTLRGYATAGDRYGYWNYLSQYDQYGSLALGVATNETTSGYVANRFFQNAYTAATGTAPTDQKLWTIGVGIMNADLDARQLAIDQGRDGLNLTAKTISDYHGEVFNNQTNGVVGREAWTAWVPLQDARSYRATASRRCVTRTFGPTF
jgi:hypothetical protein